MTPPNEDQEASVRAADEPLRPDEVAGPGEALSGGADVETARSESIDHPAKVMRLGTMLKQLLDEVREITLDEGSRSRLKDIYETSVDELSSALSPELASELDRLTSPFTEDELPTAAELRIAKAQLVGWLEGLVQGIQATLFAQQMMAQQQLAQMQQGQLGDAEAAGVTARPGTYL